MRDKDVSFFEAFHVVSLLGGDLCEQSRISKICHAKGLKIYVSENCGFLSQIHADLNNHEFVEVADGGTVKSKAPKKMTCASFSDVIDSMQWGAVHKSMRWGIPPATLSMFVWKRFVQERGNAAPSSDAAVVKDLDMFTSKCLASRGIDDDSLVLEIGAMARRALATSDVDLAPVCAVIGGVLAQDIVKVVSQHNEPIDTVFTFDGMTGEGRVTKI